MKKLNQTLLNKVSGGMITETKISATAGYFSVEVPVIFNTQNIEETNMNCLIPVGVFEYTTLKEKEEALEQAIAYNSIYNMPPNPPVSLQ